MAKGEDAKKKKEIPRPTSLQDIFFWIFWASLNFVDFTVKIKKKVKKPAYAETVGNAGNVDAEA